MVGQRRQIRQEASDSLTKLKRIECFFALLIFVFWLILFVGGITINTRPYRCAISPEGVARWKGKQFSTVVTKQISTVVKPSRAAA
jgi:hypothetical protein